jgi:3'(2'), 5'-bisphosphate nucleotidase
MGSIPIDAMIVAALEAGTEVMRCYDEIPEVTFKSDASPVTNADMISQRTIFNVLSNSASKYGIISEEGEHNSDPGNEFFLVDPLDGTKEFLNRNGEFTVNIGFVVSRVPVAGVVYAPVLRQLFWACDGRAWRAEIDGGGQVKDAREIRVREAAVELVAVGSRSHKTGATCAWLDQLRIAHTRSVGSSLKFCMIACGDADVYPRMGRTMEWDTAAADAILRAAGGMTAQINGAPMVYGKQRQNGDVDYANPPFIAYGDSRISAVQIRTS